MCIQATHVRAFLQYSKPPVIFTASRGARTYSAEVTSRQEASNLQRHRSSVSGTPNRLLIPQANIVYSRSFQKSRPYFIFFSQIRSFFTGIPLRSAQEPHFSGQERLFPSAGKRKNLRQSFRRLFQIPHTLCFCVF